MAQSKAFGNKVLGKWGAKAIKALARSDSSEIHLAQFKASSNTSGEWGAKAIKTSTRSFLSQISLA